MVAFKSRNLLFFDARTWTLIIAWYQIITCTLDVSRSHRQLIKYTKVNEQLPVIYHNFTRAAVKGNSGSGGGGGGAKTIGSPFPSSLDVYKTDNSNKDSGNNSITIIISLDGRHGNSQPSSNATSTTLPPAISGQQMSPESLVTGNTTTSESETKNSSVLLSQSPSINNTGHYSNSSGRNNGSTSNFSSNFTLWDEIQNLNGNASSNTNTSGHSLNSTDSTENVTTSDSEETRSQFLFRFRYTIIMIYADIIVYAVTAVSAIILIIGTNKGSAGMLMGWLVVNWANFLLALFAMIIVMLRALPINTFIYYAMKTGIRMLFIRVVSIHRQELLIYNDICLHLATIRQAQEAVFTMSDGMTHVNYVNP